MLAELPDLWDVNISTWPNDSQSSRFAKEAFQEEYTSFVKKLTTKPVVGVGRFTSPDTMVSPGEARRARLHRRRAAVDRRPVPAEEDRGRPDRRHPRMHRLQHLRVQRLHVDQPSLHAEPDHGRGMAPRLASRDHPAEEVGRVGAGRRRRSGRTSEAALAAARRGYEVHLAEAGSELGGRVTRESRLPGLAEWARVRDWRVTQLERMANVSIYRESALEAEHVLEFKARHVAIATGSCGGATASAARPASNCPDSTARRVHAR